MHTTSSFAKHASCTAVRALICDWCGTIESNIDSRISALMVTCKKLGYPPPSARIIKQLTGMSNAAAISTLLGTEISAEQRSAFYDLYLENVNTKPSTLLMHPKTQLQLKNLVKLGLFTNSTNALIAKNLSTYCLHGFFSHIATADDYPAKPAPDMLLVIADKLQVPSKHCLAVGDHPADLLAAHAANMRCVIVLSGFMSRDDFATLPVQPLMFCDDINALPNIITTINQT